MSHPFPLPSLNTPHTVSREHQGVFADAQPSLPVLRSPFLPPTHASSGFGLGVTGRRLSTGVSAPPFSIKRSASTSPAPPTRILNTRVGDSGIRVGANPKQALSLSIAVVCSGRGRGRRRKKRANSRLVDNPLGDSRAMTPEREGEEETNDESEEGEVSSPVRRPSSPPPRTPPRSPLLYSQASPTTPITPVEHITHTLREFLLFELRRLLLPASIPPPQQLSLLPETCISLSLQLILRNVFLSLSFTEPETLLGLNTPTSTRDSISYVAEFRLSLHPDRRKMYVSRALSHVGRESFDTTTSTTTTTTAEVIEGLVLRKLIDAGIGIDQGSNSVMRRRRRNGRGIQQLQQQQQQQGGSGGVKKMFDVKGFLRCIVSSFVCVVVESLVFHHSNSNDHSSHHQTSSPNSNENGRSSSTRKVKRKKTKKRKKKKRRRRKRVVGVGNGSNSDDGEVEGEGSNRRSRTRTRTKKTKKRKKVQNKKKRKIERKVGCLPILIWKLIVSYLSLPDRIPLTLVSHRLLSIADEARLASSNDSIFDRCCYYFLRKYANASPRIILSLARFCSFAVRGVRSILSRNTTSFSVFGSFQLLLDDDDDDETRVGESAVVSWVREPDNVFVCELRSKIVKRFTNVGTSMYSYFPSDQALVYRKGRNLLVFSHNAVSLDIPLIPASAPLRSLSNSDLHCLYASDTLFIVKGETVELWNAQGDQTQILSFPGCVFSSMHVWKSFWFLVLQCSSTVYNLHVYHLVTGACSSSSQSQPQQQQQQQHSVRRVEFVLQHKAVSYCPPSWITPSHLLWFGDDCIKLYRASSSLPFLHLYATLPSLSSYRDWSMSQQRQQQQQQGNVVEENNQTICRIRLLLAMDREPCLVLVLGSNELLIWNVEEDRMVKEIAVERWIPTGTCWDVVSPFSRSLFVVTKETQQQSPEERLRSENENVVESYTRSLRPRRDRSLRHHTRHRRHGRNSVRMCNYSIYELLF